MSYLEILGEKKVIIVVLISVVLISVVLISVVIRIVVAKNKKVKII
jgi:hypothetical protein